MKERSVSQAGLSQQEMLQSRTYTASIFDTYHSCIYLQLSFHLSTTTTATATATTTTSHYIHPPPLPYLILPLQYNQYSRPPLSDIANSLSSGLSQPPYLPCLPTSCYLSPRAVSLFHHIFHLSPSACQFSRPLSLPRRQTDRRPCSMSGVSVVRSQRLGTQ